jgi:hypothetical protein
MEVALFLLRQRPRIVFSDIYIPLEATFSLSCWIQAIMDLAFITLWRGAIRLCVWCPSCGKVWKINAMSASGRP